MRKSLLDTALKIALDNLSKHPEYEHYPHYTFVVKDNQIVEWATNTAQAPPKHYGYGARIKGAIPKTHSEINAYIKSRRIIGKQSFQIINIRLNKSRKMRLSKPCVCCHDIMVAMGCTKFYYSSEIGFLRS